MKSFPFKFRRSYRNVLTEYCIPKSNEYLSTSISEIIIHNYPRK